MKRLAWFPFQTFTIGYNDNSLMPKIQFPGQAIRMASVYGICFAGLMLYYPVNYN